MPTTPTTENADHDDSVEMTQEGLFATADVVHTTGEAGLYEFQGPTAGSQVPPCADFTESGNFTVSEHIKIKEATPISHISKSAPSGDMESIILEANPRDVEEVIPLSGSAKLSLMNIPRELRL